jgi:hypothetical protein
VVDNSSSALCLACHVSQPSQSFSALSVRTTTASKGSAGSASSAGSPSSRGTTYNPFASWRLSIHAQASYKVSKTANAGPYGNMQRNACSSCHAAHNAPGGQMLLSGPMPVVPSMDAATQNCISCHNGGSNLSPAIPNIYAEFAKTGHPFPAGSNKHSANEGTVLNNNRHATCVDCHDPHASQQTGSFVSTAIRASQSGAVGVSATDGTTATNPAVNQYETCLRCHGTSSGKQALTIFGYQPVRAATGGDPLNLLPQFSVTAKSSHPVMHDSNSGLPQPSLLKTMWNLDGLTQGRTITARILCTDCHNSDDNREFGGTGPNGPHGSKFSHILERRYEFSQVAPGSPPAAGPGTTIQNLLPAVLDPGAGGPYSLCAKCHDLNNIMSNASFTQHNAHISGKFSTANLGAGFSCSVCHTAHGMGASASNASGVRMINFDLEVVAPNDNAASISYIPGTGCTLKCHNYNHNGSNPVTLSVGGGAKTSGVSKH